MCQLHFCCSVNTILLFTAGYASTFLIVFHPDTVILSFLCFMTVLQAPASRLSQDVNYWWEIEFVPLKLLSPLERSSSIIGLLNCFFDSVAVSCWCGLLPASPESGTPGWGTHTWQQRRGCRHICRWAESGTAPAREGQEVGKLWNCQEWFIHGAWSF